MAEFDLTVPVLVAGAGAAGVAAGLAVASAGLEVLLIEQDAVPAGSTGMSQGLMCAAGTRAQANVGVEDQADLLFADIMAKTRGLADPRLARAISSGSGPGLDWLVEHHDVPLTLDQSYRAGFGHSRPRLHGWAGHSGQDLRDLLHVRFAAAGGLVATRTQLDSIILDHGKVAGIGATRPGGELNRIGCSALILACGGFAANRALVAEHMPDAAAALYNGHEGSRGDAIRIAQTLGAATAQMGSYQGYGLLATPPMISVPPRLVQEGAVLLNAHGDRFVDEIDDVTGLIHPVLAQPGAFAWLVYDLHVAARCEGTVELQQLDALGAAREGGTTCVLASATGMAEGALSKALADIDLARRSGERDQVGRQWAVSAATQSALRALKVTGALYHTQGGLKTDAALRVLTDEGSPIDGLYAAGGTACGVSGPSYWGYLPAMGLGSAVIGGLIAGRAAAGEPALA